LESSHIAADNKWKYVEKIILWFIPSASNSITVTVVTDDNNKFSQDLTFKILAATDFKVLGGVYSQSYFSDLFYDVDLTGMDYRVININKTCRWIKYFIRNTEGNVSFQGITIVGQTLQNNEGRVQ
jgi:hypothetical protein